jgi:hypothetical protein
MFTVQFQLAGLVDVQFVQIRRQNAYSEHYCAGACYHPGRRGPSACCQSIAVGNAPCLVLECCVEILMECFQKFELRVTEHKVTVSMIGPPTTLQSLQVA